MLNTVWVKTSKQNTKPNWMFGNNYSLEIKSPYMYVHILIITVQGLLVNIHRKGDSLIKAYILLFISLSIMNTIANSCTQLDHISTTGESGTRLQSMSQTLQLTTIIISSAQLTKRISYGNECYKF